MTSDDPLATLRTLRRRRRRLLDQLREVERFMGKAMALAKQSGGTSDERLAAEAGVSRETAGRWWRTATTTVIEANELELKL